MFESTCSVKDRGCLSLMVGCFATQRPGPAKASGIVEVYAWRTIDRLFEADRNRASSGILVTDMVLFFNKIDICNDALFDRQA